MERMKEIWLGKGERVDNEERKKKVRREKGSWLSKEEREEREEKRESREREEKGEKDSHLHFFNNI